MQLLKAPPLIVVTLFGIIKLPVNPVQSPKAPDPIVVMLFGSVRFPDNPVHP